jgi:hypothetical protein
MRSIRLRARRWLTVCAASIVLLAGLEGCATPGGRSKESGIIAAGRRIVARRHSKLAAAGLSPSGATEAPDLVALYNKSIYVSAVFRSDRQVSNLRQVTTQNVPVVMGSFVSCQGCNCQGSGGVASGCSSKCCLGAGTRTMPSDVWVSFGDEVVSFCSKFPKEDLILRMQQLQGLPPQLSQPVDSWKFLIVKITSPDQLFRPCANPDPSTPGPCPADFPAGVSTDREAWIAEQALFAWQLYTGAPSTGGYPWTRLGYTYNWNPDASYVGTSEFVIPDGTQVQVCGVVSAADFCFSGKAPSSYCPGGA